MSKQKPRRSFSPATRRSKSPSSSSLSLSRSSDKTSSGSRSPRRSRSPIHKRSRRNSDVLDISSYSRRKPVSRERRGSRLNRRSVSPLSRRRRFSPPRSRSPISSRRSNSPYKRSPSPRTLTWSSRRMSPPPTRGHRRSRSPPGKRQNGRQHSEDQGHSSTSRPASERIRYPSKPGPIGRYNSRLDGEWAGGGEGQKTEWTCNQCSEIFYEQKLYSEHVKERNLKRKCPGIEELLVVDNSPPAVVKTERTRPAQKRSGRPIQVFLDYSPPYIALDLSDEALTLPPPSKADSDTELPPIVPPPAPDLSQFSLETFSDQSLPTSSLETISDQSLPTSPVSTLAPTSLPVGPNCGIPSLATGSSPPRLAQEMMQSRVKFREDGVLIVDKVTIQARKIIQFKKNLFKALPDLLDIPDTTYNTSKKSEPEVQSTPAEVVTEDPTVSPACGGLVLTKSLESANSLLQSLPNNPHPFSLEEGSEPKRKLPRCLREDNEIEEPDSVSIVRAPKPLYEMELLLDKRIRKQFFQKKATSKENAPESTMKSTKPNQCAIRPCNPSQKFDSALEPTVVVGSSFSKKKKKSKKRRLKDNMKNLLQEAANLPTIPSSSSPIVESKASQPKATSRCPASLQPVVSSSTGLEHAIPSPVSSCSQSESLIVPTIVPVVPSIFQLPAASASPPVAAMPSSIFSITPISATTSLSASMSPPSSSLTTSKKSTITYSLLSTSSSAQASTRPNSPNPASISSTALLEEKLSPKVSSTFVSSDPKTDNFTTKASGGVFTMALQLGSPPQASPPAFTDTVNTKPSPGPSPVYGGEVMSLYQALGGISSEDDHEESPQPVIIRAGVDPMDKCPDCKAKLETGSRALNFSLNMVDLSILVDCMQCGVRVRLKGVLGARQKAVLGCGM